VVAERFVSFSVEMKIASLVRQAHHGFAQGKHAYCVLRRAEKLLVRRILHIVVRITI